jgi:hypothetical protein
VACRNAVSCVFGILLLTFGTNKRKVLETCFLCGVCEEDKVADVVLRCRALRVGGWTLCLFGQGYVQCRPPTMMMTIKSKLEPRRVTKVALSVVFA